MLDPSLLTRRKKQGEAECDRALDAAEVDRRLSQSDLGLRMLATLVELLTTLDTHTDLAVAANYVSQLTSEILPVNRVLVFWRNDSRSRLKLVGDSSDSELTGDAGFVRLAVAAAEETVVRRGCFCWCDPASESAGDSLGDRDGMLAVAQFARHCESNVVSGVPLQCVGQEASGVILVLSEQQGDAEVLLETIGEPVAQKLESIEATQPTWLECKVRVGQGIFQSGNRRLMLAIAAGTLLLCMLPLRYVVPADIELQANERRFVAVPFDGPLRSSMVRPGDLVQVGDLLAEIDPRELEYELSGVNAELERALQEKKAQMVERNVAASQMAGLDSQRLRSEADLLTLRRQNLEIRSPIAGVIVRGDLERSWGMPMTRGDTLFEVAPLAVMQVDIAVPEDEIRHVRVGMNVDFFLDALPERALRGTISWIHPRAELVENNNVFIARMKLANPDLLYRPGMRGRARIKSDRHPLIWNYLHKPYHALRHALGW
jgi:hypothetical protein